MNFKQNNIPDFTSSFPQGYNRNMEFIDISKKDFEAVKWQIVIHVVFLFSTLMLAYTEKLMVKTKPAKA